MDRFKIALIALAVLAALSVPQARARQCPQLDANHDQRVTASDALIVLRASVGLGCRE